MIRIPANTRFRRLGYPIIPDSIHTASGAAWGFSPQTPDAIEMQALQAANQQLPPDLAAAWAAAYGSGSSGAAGQVARAASPAPQAAASPSGTPLSTQTAAAVRLLNIMTIAPNVFQCFMSDGSKHYCDVDGNPISYTPPPAQPAVTPSASLPTAAVSPTVQPVAPQPGATPAPVAVSPSGAVISTTSGTPTPAPVPQSFTLDLSSIMSWLQGSMFGGLPNWLLVGGAALLLMGGDSSNSRRRR